MVQPQNAQSENNQAQNTQIWTATNSKLRNKMVPKSAKVRFVKPIEIPMKLKYHYAFVSFTKSAFLTWSS